MTKVYENSHLNRIYDFIQAGVGFIERSQEKENIPNKRFKGEWPSEMIFERDSYVGKKGDRAYDSNSFTTSLINIILADVYLNLPGFENIPAMLANSAKAIFPFMEKNKVYFWHKLPLPQEFQTNAVKETRRPIDYVLQFNQKESSVFGMFGGNNLLYAAANFAPDLDCTAIAYLAFGKTCEIDPNVCKKLPRLEDPKELFSAYRNLPGISDEYLATDSGRFSKGAFLTWYGDEALVEFIPDVSFKTQYIPYGMNDADCITNANIINSLAYYDRLDLAGVEDACNFIVRTFDQGKQDECGIYYENKLTPHYAIAHAFYNGADCLDAAAQIIIDELLYRQNDDGSWSSDLTNDNIHTTLYALNALLYIGGATYEYEDEVIDRAVRYILDSAVVTEGGALYWKPGVMFSAGKIKGVNWRSESYTTALAVEALSMYLLHLQDRYL